MDADNGERGQITLTAVRMDGGGREEKVHRIARDILKRHGKPIRKVAEDLNRPYAGKRCIQTAGSSTSRG
jgi:hypothetical protein